MFSHQPSAMTSDILTPAHLLRGPMLESRSLARREFLKFVAASPYVAALGGVRALRADEVIAAPADALSVMDFEEAAHRTVLPGHWAYMKSGVDDDGTLRTNRESYS